MEFKIFKSDNVTNLRIKLDVTYKELRTVRSLQDINVKDEDGKTIFKVLESQSVAVATNAVAFPMPNRDTKVNITAQLNDEDELSMKYYVALIKKGLVAYLKNFEKARKEITVLAEGIEVE